MSVTSQNLMEFLLWLLILIYTPHSVQSTNGPVAWILLKWCEIQIFLYKWLTISNWIPFQIKDTSYSYLYSCLTYSQCEALNTRLPGFEIFSFWWHIFHYDRLPIINRIPFQIKASYYYLYSRHRQIKSKLLRIEHIHGVTITKIRPPWHVLLDYFATREFIKNL